MPFQIGNQTVSATSPAYIIAEACDNHLGDLQAAKEMCVQAKLAGANAIKFQHHLLDEEMLPDVPSSSNFNMPLYEFLKKHALTLGQHRELMGHCRDIGIQYICTPFSYKAAEEMVSIGLDVIKIGSGEMTDLPSLRRMADHLRKPMIVSTGMSTLEEIDRTYQTLVSTGVPFALMNCVSEYPPVYEDVNLRVIETMQRRYLKAVIGHSDHTPDLYTCFAAVTLGAKIIEKHVILDKQQPGPDQSVSIDFREFAALVDGIRKVEAALGDEKKVHGQEKQIRQWAFRSLVTTRCVRQGEVLSGEMIWSKRPGTGIPSHLRDRIVGRRAVRDIPSNALLTWDDMDGERLA